MALNRKVNVGVVGKRERPSFPAAIDKPPPRVKNPRPPETSGTRMTDAKLQTLIERAFEDRARINPQTTGEVREAVDKALDLLDAGKARVAEKIEGATGPNSWKVNQWLKKARSEERRVGKECRSR